MYNKICVETLTLLYNNTCVYIYYKLSPVPASWILFRFYMIKELSSLLYYFLAESQFYIILLFSLRFVFYLVCATYNTI